VSKLLEAGKLKHRGIIKAAIEHDETGQPSQWKSLFNVRLGIHKTAVAAVDQQSNTGNKKTVTLLCRYDARLSDGQILFVFGSIYSISQLDNVDFANRRLYFTATEL
jgi:hypothetical protein